MAATLSRITLSNKINSHHLQGKLNAFEIQMARTGVCNAAYEEAIRLVRKSGGLMQALKQARQIGDYLAELRLQFKAKRNFIKLLDGVARSTLGAK